MSAPGERGRDRTSAVAAGVRRLFRIGRVVHDDVRRDLDDEIRFHFERTVEDLVAGGAGREAAEREARRRFGDEARWRDTLESIDRGTAARRRRADGLAALGEDLRDALRGIARARGFTAAVVLTFALGLGANATMFGIIDRLLLSPPGHIASPDEVKRVMVMRAFRPGSESRPSDALTYPDYEDFQGMDAFASVAGYAPRGVTLGRGESALPADAVMVTAGYWDLLGVRPALGRFFTPEEDEAGAAGVAVLGWGLWQREFGGDPEAIGRTVDFGYGSYTIIGVAPQGFTGVNLEAVDLWLPLHTAATAVRGTRWATSRNWYWLRVVARLAPGVVPEGAEAEATAVHLQARQEQIAAGDYDANARVRAGPLIAARGPLASEESAVARWLAGVSLIVLLIACANVANLLLARGLRRRRETGIRLALGISRGRLLRQTLLESLVLAALGGGAALLVTRWGGDVVRRVLLPEVTWTDSVVGGSVLLFVAVAAVLTGLLSGVVPAIQASRPRLTEALKSGARGTSAAGGRTRSALTITQAALSVVLLVGAGLFLRSLDRVRGEDLGVEPDGLVMVELIGAQELEDAERTRLFERLDARLAALPVVERVSPTVGLPFWSTWVTTLNVPGLDSVPRLPETGRPVINVGDPDLLATLGLELRRGRAFTERDAEGSAPVAVVNETMARVVWPREEAIGKCLLIGSDDPPPNNPPCTTVVGVVEDGRVQQIVEEPSMQYYVPLAQRLVDWAPEALLVRVRGDERAAIPAIRREILAAEPSLRYAEVRPMRDLIDPQARSWQLGAALFTAFGLLALLVAGIGLYSVLAFDVAQRTREIGIRAALGATRERVLRLVVGQGVRVVAIGVVLGGGAAFLLAPRVEALLFETPARDPWTFGAVVLTLGLVALVASALPALRATRVDPREALQAE
ncbi:MAG TPA: ABC transporter permease [Longimicrobiales bacterium]|nr:ABC transporter permease [Longimicrobiales bacterium]